MFNFYLFFYIKTLKKDSLKSKDVLKSTFNFRLIFMKPIWILSFKKNKCYWNFTCVPPPHGCVQSVKLDQAPQSPLTKKQTAITIF